MAVGTVPHDVLHACVPVLRERRSLAVDDEFFRSELQKQGGRSPRWKTRRTTGHPRWKLDLRNGQRTNKPRRSKMQTLPTRQDPCSIACLAWPHPPEKATGEMHEYVNQTCCGSLHANLGHSAAQRARNGGGIQEGQQSSISTGIYRPTSIDNQDEGCAFDKGFEQNLGDIMRTNNTPSSPRVKTSQSSASLRITLMRSSTRKRRIHVLRILRAHARS